ncbi:MAG: tetratricopeptide repeat protein [Planctomycetota bacterium]|nr:tetratricopeptide repeat protein [Planctomycetota bacterium]
MRSNIPLALALAALPAVSCGCPRKGNDPAERDRERCGGAGAPYVLPAEGGRAPGRGVAGPDTGIAAGAAGGVEAWPSSGVPGAGKHGAGSQAAGSDGRPAGASAGRTAEENGSRGKGDGRESQDRAGEAELAGAAELTGAGRDREAAEKLEALCRKYPSDPEVHYRLGVLHARAGRHKEAVEYLLAASKLDPKSPRALRDLALVYCRMQRIEDAMKVAKEACHLDVTSPASFNVLGLICLAAEDGRNAEIAFSEAVSRSPNNPMYLHNLGRAYTLCGDLRRAKQCYDETIKLAPTSDAYNDRGRTLEALDDRKGAMSDYLAAVKADPGNAVAHYNLARLYMDRMDPERFDPRKAVTHAKKAAALSGETNARYLSLLSRAFLANRQLDEAIETQRKAVNLDPSAENRRLLQELLDEKSMSPRPYKD